MKFPGLISKGTNLTEWSRDVSAYLRSITPRNSGGIAVSIGPGGATFAPQQNPPPQKSSQLAYRPLQLLVTSDSTGQQYLSAIWGTVGGITPKLDGDYLYQLIDDGTGNYVPPKSDITLPSSSTSDPLVVYLDCDVVGGTMTGASLTTCTGLTSVPSDTDYKAYLVLGTINSAAAISQQIFGPLGYIAAWKGQTDPSGSTYIVHRFFGGY